MCVSNLTFIHWSIHIYPIHIYPWKAASEVLSSLLKDTLPCVSRLLFCPCEQLKNCWFGSTQDLYLGWQRKEQSFGAKKTPGQMKDNLSIWHSIWFLKCNFEIIIIYICLCPCTRVIQACSGIQNLGCWSHTVVSMRQLWFAKFFFWVCEWTDSRHS